MAKNRYGRIHHSNHHHINLRFPSADARDAFAVKFEKYHEGHDHDGEVPRFEEIKAAAAGSTTYESGKLHDAHAVTIDGYATYEIEEYHADEKHTHYYRYRPPTCCVPPLISIDRKLVESGTLQRHELSAIFGDMPDDDFKHLRQSIEFDGFIDNVIRLYEGQILDGWHRYRAAKELNLIRKLRFTQWHEDAHRDGDPKPFVYAKNMERRHQDKAVRAQIAVAFHKRFGHGGDRASHQNDDLKSQQQDSGTPNGEPKTREELAKEAGVSTATIDRAIAIEKEGESEAVIAGEKTAGEVIKARDAEKLKKRKKQVLKNMWDTRIQVARDYTGEGATDLNQYLSLPELEKAFATAYEDAYADAFMSGMSRIDRAVSFNNFEERALDVDEFGNAKLDMEDLEAEHRAITTYAGDIRLWQRPDWSPDTNWILPLIAAKKKSEETPDTEPAKSEAKVSTQPSGCEDTSLPNLKTLREQVKKWIPKYKEWYKKTGYKEYDLIAHASFSQFIVAYRDYNASEVEGAATAEELKGLLERLKSKCYIFARRLRKINGGLQESNTDTQADSESNTDEADRSLDERMEQCRADLTEVYQQAYTWEGLEINLYAEEYGLSADVIAQLQQEIDAEYPPAYQKIESTSPTDAGCEVVEDLEEDTSLTEIDNLPAVEHFLGMLHMQVDTFVHPHTKDNISLAIYDLFTEDGEGDEEDEWLTERQMLAILIDVAHTIVTESESNSV